MHAVASALDHGKLIAADAPMPIRDSRDQCGAWRDVTRTCIEHDEIVAEAMHLQERQFSGARICHGRGYNLM